MKTLSTPDERDIREDREADLIRATERERLRALVEGDMEVARRLHADDFQLINPAGNSVSKEQYLGGIASGRFKYLMWEPGPIAVHVQGQMAVIRYQSQVQIMSQGETSHRRGWHTDFYQKRNDSWQVVWSHATEIK